MLAGALVGAAAVLAAVPLVHAAWRPQAEPAAVESSGPTVEPSPSESGEPAELVSTAACGTAITGAELTIPEIQGMLTCAAEALKAPDLVISAERPDSRQSASGSLRLTAPVTGGRLLVHQELTDWVLVDGEYVEQPGGANDVLIVLEADGRSALSLDHADREYTVSEDWGNADHLDPDGVGWTADLLDYWRTIQAFVQTGADPAVADSLTLLGPDQQDSRAVVKIGLIDALLPDKYREGLATSAELWVYLDDGMPARLVFNYDLAEIREAGANLDPDATTIPWTAWWCWTESTTDQAAGPCADQPVIFRWFNTADPARDITLEIPDGYTEFVSQEWPWGIQPEDARFFEDDVEVEPPKGLEALIMVEPGGGLKTITNGVESELPDSITAVQLPNRD
jgi:hypothetical protein